MILYPHNGNQQLFDLENDPQEMTNVIEDKKYKKIKKELFAKLLSLQKEVGDTLTVSLK